MHVTLHDASEPTWNAEIDRIGALLDVQNNPSVFPYHFLQVVLPGLGGAIVEVTASPEPNSRRRVVGFLLPRGRSRAAGDGDARNARKARAYTFRYHILDAGARYAAFVPEIAETIRSRLGASAVIPYSPRGTLTYTRTESMIGNAHIGHPDAAEAAQIRDLYQAIWNSPIEYVYPTDIHSDQFDLGTSLVARVEGQVAGFLFGFNRFQGPKLPEAWADRYEDDLRLESQVMGVSPQFRGMRLGNLLKRAQAEQALANNIPLIHWTADPLQYPNAALNFGLLRAVAFSFHPDYYPFRNDLNRAPASRLALTWLVDTGRVRDVPVTGSSALIMDLQPEFARVNDAAASFRLDIDQPYIAIEIPANWGELQRTDLAEALKWREITDQIFSHYIGIEDGRYVITGVAIDRQSQSDKRYLIAQRADETLWRRLAS